MDKDKMLEKALAKRAKTLLKMELTRRDMNYNDLLKKLKEIGIEENYDNLAAKISRGKFSFIFVMQCLMALGIKEFKFEVPSTYDS